MFSFRSISLVATLAFAAFTSAAPLEGRQNLGGVGAPIGSVEPILDSLLGSETGVMRRDHEKSLGVPDHFKVCHDAVVAIVADVEIALKGDIKVDIVAGLLAKVVVVLDALVVALKVYITEKADAKWYCLSAGLLITLEEVAVIVCGLIQVVFGLLCLVVKAGIYADLTVVLGDICVALWVVIQLTVQICIGLTPILISVVAAVDVIVADVAILLACLKVDAFLKLCGFLALH